MNFNTLNNKCGVLLEGFFYAECVKSIKRHIFSHGDGGLLGEQLERQNALKLQVRGCLTGPLEAQIQAAVMQESVLTLFVGSPVWASRLRYMAPDLQRQLRQRGVKVDQIRIRIIPETRPDSRPGYPRPRRLSEENSEILRQTARGIEDTPLKEALLRLSRHRLG